MKTITPCPDVLTRKGRTTLADNLRRWSVDPEFLDGVTIGPFKLKGGLALRAAADVIERRGSERAERPSTGLPDDVLKFDAVRLYGSPEAGLAAIRRQLGIQSADMDPADVKRCKRAARMLESHLYRLAERKAAEDAAEAEAQTLATAKPMDPKNPPPVGAEVFVNANYREFKGAILEIKDKPHRILGKKEPHARVQFTHKRKTVDGIYGFVYHRKMAAQWVCCRDILLPTV